MDSSQQQLSLPSPESPLVPSTCSDIPPSSYLTVPSCRPPRPISPLSRQIPIEEDDDEDLRIFEEHTPTALRILVPSRRHEPTNPRTSPSPLTRPPPLSTRLYMSVYSSSSIDTAHSDYSNPPARSYRVPDYSNMSSSRKITPVRPTHLT
jgi:hypothetical protein